VNDLDVKKMVDAIQVQIDRDWTPAWGIPAKLTVVPHGQKPPSGMWWQTIFDTADQAGALGYHDLTSAGLPIGKVFAKTTFRRATACRSPSPTRCWRCWATPTST